MNFKDVTPEITEQARAIYWNKEVPWDDRMATLKKLFGKKGERTVRRWCSEKLGFPVKPIIEPEQYVKAKDKVYDKNKKRFLITWAQNNTPIHTQFFENMKSYADFIDASIHVIAGRYKNPTSVFDDKDFDYWDESVLPYLDANKHSIHKYLTILSDSKVQPTAVNPMTGMEGMTGIESCVIGSPKMQLDIVPVLKKYAPKIMLTSGACSRKNYTESKIGKKAEFHHTYGFVIIEIKDSEIFYARQITADEKTGAFIDLCFNVNNGIVETIDEIEGIVLGDLHYGDHNPLVLENTFKLTDILRPKYVVLHDVFDAKSISHHTQQDPFAQYGLEKNNLNNLQDEINNLMSGLDLFRGFENVIIVRSNHDTHLDKFLANDWRRLPTSKNSLTYMKLSKRLLEQYEKKNKRELVIGVIPELINEEFPNYITLNYNDSFRIKNWEVGNHGDIGSSGTRGAPEQFRRLNTKMICGHTHTPKRKDGLVYAGTSTYLRLDYNKGASSWLNSHVIIHKNGKIQHINFIGKNKEFTTLFNI